MKKIKVFNKKENHYEDYAGFMNNELYIATAILENDIKMTKADMNDYLICDFQFCIGKTELYEYDVFVEDDSLYTVINNCIMRIDTENVLCLPQTNERCFADKPITKVGTFIPDEEQTIVFVPLAKKNTWYCPICGTPLLTPLHSDLSLSEFEELKECKHCLNKININEWEKNIERR